MTTDRTALAIVGIGCLFPKADGPGAFWANVKNKVDGIGPVPPTHWNPDDYFDADPKRPDMTYARRGGFLDAYPFAPGEFGIAPNDLEATDTSQLLALVATQMALRDAGLLQSPPAATGGTDLKRVSVILGVTGTLELVIPLGARLGHPLWRKAMKEAGVADDVAERIVDRIADGYVGWQENSFPGLLGNVVAGRIANRLDLGGTNCVVDAACASSLSALHLAALELQNGRADAVVTGGVDTFNDIFMYMCFSKTPALSPTGDAKPFDAAGDGTILGEGLGVVVLKRLADAERDGNRIYATVKGIGSSSDGKGNAVYAPVAAGQKRCLLSAYEQAGVSPDTIELIEAHGTGTKVGDATEIEALRDVFRDASPKRSSPWCAVGSVKSQIGHTKAAAGAAGLIKAALALYHKVLPPTIKVKKPLDVFADSPFAVNAECRPWLPRDRHPRRAGVSAFGFGGSNFHCVLEEHGRAKPGIDWDGNVQIVALSAETETELKSKARVWDELQARSASKDDGHSPLLALRASWHELRARAAESRRTFDPRAPHRLTFVVSREKPTDGNRWEGSSPAPGKLGFLFPGQGAQSVGMLRDLACTFPVVQDVLVEADRAFAAGLVDPGDRRLSDFVYPPHAFTPDERATQEEALRATQVAQPALGAVSLGALQILAQFGVRPDATAGHSYGELTALCAAGCFDAPSLFELSQLRGRLMADRPGGLAAGGDAGAMLAVQAPLAEVETLVARDRFDLVIANKNSPAQAVLSGRTAEIERAAKALGERKVRHVRLPVAAAFHSPLVADAAEPFRAALEPIAFHTAQLPVYANSTAREYPRDPQSARDLLAQQLAKPVEFVDQVRNMAAAGVRTFVEVGPGRTLTRLVESILEGTPHHAIALDASAGAKPGMLDLAHTLARLAALGHPVNLAAWDADAPALPAASSKPTLTVPICGANYRSGSGVRGLGSGLSGKQPAATRLVTPVPPPPASPDPRPQTPDPRPETKMAEPTAGLSHALQVTLESLAAFQRLQEQTASLHRQFLETQESAQRTLQTLVDGQQRMLAASLGLPVAAPPPVYVSPPAPTGRPALLAPPPAPAIVREAPKPIPVPRQSPAALVAAAPIASDSSHVQSVLVAVVAEKTGYPPEMLDLDMGLDADLGIDSIKRVEILSALQERLPDAPAVKPEHLGTLHTLRDIAAFLAAGEPARVSGRSAGAGASLLPLTRAGSPDSSHVQSVLVAVVAEKTGYPPEMLDLDMGLDADLGIDSIKRVEILSALQERLPDAPAVKPEHLGSLHTLRDIAAFLANSDAADSRGGVSPPETVPGRGNPALTAAPVPALARFKVRRGEPPGNRPAVTLAPGSEVWLIADAEPLADAVALGLAGRGVVPRRHGWADALPAAHRLAGLMLIAPTNFGDDLPAHALRWLQTAGPALRQSRGAFATLTRLGGSFGFDTLIGNPLAGALAGLAKTAGFEWPEVACKAIDIASAADAADAVDEMLTRGPTEVGIAAACRFAPTLEDSPVTPTTVVPFDSSDVVVVSGGARGVTAEVAVALAASRPTLVLLGRSPEPTLEPANIAACPDEPSLKRTLAARSGATPKQIDAEIKAILAGREVRRTLDRIAAAGAKAVYKSVDIRDVAAVARALDGFRVTGVVHGAGVLADRKIDDLTVEQFDAVWSTKVAGLQALLAATEGHPLKLLAIFSSSTGRFGRTGQAAYAAANEALNKLAQAESRRRPGCRVVALNWGPWDGGMVTPGLAKRFAAEGVGLIPLAAGAQHLVAECAANDAVEVVLLAPGSDLPNKAYGWQPVGEAAQVTVFEKDLDLTRAPVLRAHVIDGRAVMPLALSLEWLAHAAMHGSPGLAFVGCDNLRVLNSLIVPDGRPTTVRAVAGKSTRDSGLYRVAVELRGDRDGRDIAFSRADVLLADVLPPAPPREPWPALPPYPLDVDDVYQRVLFHGPELRGLESIDGCGPAGISVTASSAPAPAAWLTQPLRATWLADPMVLDCAFQAMIVWTHAERASLSLPVGLNRYRQFRRSFPVGEVCVVARITGGAGATVRADIDVVGPDGALVACIDGYECVLDGRLTAAFRRNRPEPARV